jgi:hypothetical protein
MLQGWNVVKLAAPLKKKNRQEITGFSILVRKEHYNFTTFQP